MKSATLAQGNQVISLILQKRILVGQLQNLIESGLLSALLDANVDRINQRKFLWLLGLRSQAMEGVPVLRFLGHCSSCGRIVNLIESPWFGEDDEESFTENAEAFGPRARYLISPHGREAMGCGGNYKSPRRHFSIGDKSVFLGPSITIVLDPDGVGRIFAYFDNRKDDHTFGDRVCGNNPHEATEKLLIANAEKQGIFVNLRN